MNIAYNGEKGKACKDIFSTVIPKLVELDRDVVYLDADLMGCIGTVKWALNHPSRAINCGISESNMIGIASGMSATGLKPIVHTFGPFASRRVFDQVFLSAGYAGNSITVIGSDPGVTAAFNGGTHMPFEDIALYRTIPGATIYDVTDYVMLEDALKTCINLPGVKYIRSMRKDNIKVYEEGTRFTPGKAVTVIDNGNDIAIFASGIMVAKAIEASKKLLENGIKAKVIDPVTIKPLDNDMVVKCARECKCILTCENHNKIGGLYSAVSEVASKLMPVKMDHVAVEDKYGEVGPQNYLEEVFNLTTDEIVKKATKLLNK